MQQYPRGGHVSTRESMASSGLNADTEPVSNSDISRAGAGAKVRFGPNEVSVNNLHTHKEQSGEGDDDDDDDDYDDDYNEYMDDNEDNGDFDNDFDNVNHLDFSNIAEDELTDYQFDEHDYKYGEKSKKILRSNGRRMSSHTARLHKPIGPNDRFSLLIGCYLLINNNAFSTFILLVIISNCALIAIEATSYQYRNLGWYLSLVDNVFLGIYVMEAALKLYVYRLDYFKLAKNNFDFFIFWSSMLYFFAKFAAEGLLSKGPNFVHLLKLTRALRAIRSLRAMRAISGVRSLQTLISTLTASIPAVAAICSLGFLVLCIFAVLGRSIFSNIDDEVFGSVWKTAYWLFSLISLDSWTKIPRQLNGSLISSLSLFAALFVFIESFIVLSLFTAAMCSVLKDSQLRRRIQTWRKSRRLMRRVLAIVYTFLSAQAVKIIASLSLENAVKNKQPPSADSPPNQKSPSNHDSRKKSFTSQDAAAVAAAAAAAAAAVAEATAAAPKGGKYDRYQINKATKLLLLMFSQRTELTFGEKFLKASAEAFVQGKKFKNRGKKNLGSPNSAIDFSANPVAGAAAAREEDFRFPGELVLQYFGRDAIRGSGDSFAEFLATLESTRIGGFEAEEALIQQQLMPLVSPDSGSLNKSLPGHHPRKEKIAAAKLEIEKYLRETRFTDSDKNMALRLLASLEWGIADEHGFAQISDDLVSLLFENNPKNKELCLKKQEKRVSSQSAGSNIDLLNRLAEANNRKKYI